MLVTKRHMSDIAIGMSSSFANELDRRNSIIARDWISPAGRMQTDVTVPMALRRNAIK